MPASVNKPVGPNNVKKKCFLLCDFKIVLTVFNQSYNCQTSHYLGRNRLPKLFLMLPSLGTRNGLNDIASECGLFLTKPVKVSNQYKCINESQQNWPLSRPNCPQQREITLRDSLQKFITFHKARSVYL